MRTPVWLSLGLLAAPNAAAQLLVPESTNDDVMLFDAFDGSLLNPQFLDLNISGGTAPGTPQELIFAPNGDILVSDQIADRIFRFSADGTTSLGESTTPLDNLRGLESAYGFIWAANAGTANGAPGNAIVQLDLSLNLVAVHPQTYSPWDLKAFRRGGVDGLLVTDGGRNLRFFDPANPSTPVLLADQTASTLNFGQYMTDRQSTGNLLVAGWSAPSGGYEFETTNFTLASFIDIQGLFAVSGVRSIYELGNGNFLVSGSGVRVYDPIAGTLTDIVPTVAARAITVMPATNIGTNYCGPAATNASGNSGVMSATGSASVSANNLTLTATGLTTNAFSYFIAGRTQGFIANPGGSAGNLCLAGAIGRVVGGSILNSGAAGSISVAANLTALPQPTGPVAAAAGETWHFQCWFRDVAGSSATSNFSDGLRITFN